MGRGRTAPGPELVKLKTRKQRRAADLAKKLGIWFFVLCFVASIVGVALITVSR
jgi:hypothetical protein